MTKLAEKIHKLHNQGKTYREIAKILDCARSTVCYHCGRGQKTKSKLRVQKTRKNQHPYTRKLENFKTSCPTVLINKPQTHQWEKLISLKLQTFFRPHNDRKGKIYVNPTFTTEDIIKKFGENPKCYLTGETIDIYKPRTYQFDHIKPVSKGGKNTLDNLGICTKDANQCKKDLTKDQFIDLCKRVLEHNGHKVT